MVHPKFKDIGDPAIRLIEECSELIKAVCKGERFGWKNFHPDRKQTNLIELHNEWGDLQRSYKEFIKRVIDNLE